MGACLFLLSVLGGAPLVDAGAVVGGVTAESDVQVVQELVHACVRCERVCVRVYVDACVCACACACACAMKSMCSKSSASLPSLPFVHLTFFD